ncbi:MAG: hypothetical protein AAB467_04845, partial [Patescibacteria group bacterium]
AQFDRWTNARRNKVVSSVGDTKVLEKEITKLKDEGTRYNKAYGAGAFTIEQLKEYTTPVKEQINSLESQIAKAKQQENQINITAMPSNDEVRSFAEESAKALTDLSFGLKRAIMINVIEKVVATQQRLEVNGYIPLISNYVGHQTSYRHRRPPERR